MNTLIHILAAALGSLFDPLAVGGYLVAGIFLRSIWLALAGATAWAAAMEALSSSIANYPFGELLLPRVVGAMIFTAIVFVIAKLIREPRA